jgi:hypothetical protein
LSCLFLFSALAVNGQKKIASGLFISAGYSFSKQPDDNPNIQLAGILPAVSGGLYSFIPLSSEKSVVSFRSLKLTMGLISLQSGFYELNSSTVQLTQLSTDLSVLFPLRLRFSEDSEIYCAIGGAAGFPLIQNFRPDNLSIESNKKIQPGLAFEYGFLFKGKNLINLNMTHFGGPFPMSEVKITFGFSGGNYKSP